MRFRRLVVLFCAALLAGLPAVAADRAVVLKAAREIAQKARYATFITIGEDGQPQARIVDDPAVKAKHRKSAWAPFYKNEHRDADFALIDVVPRRLEVVSQGHGLVNDPVTWRPVLVDFAAKAP
ncbi:MAG: hypothetical protein ACM369_15030 [Acidobacteriota bacterium]